MPTTVLIAEDYQHTQGPRPPDQQKEDEGEKLLQSVARALLKQTSADRVVEEFKRIGVDSTTAHRVTQESKRFRAVLGGKEPDSKKVVRIY